jgi:hypothetical protein
MYSNMTRNFSQKAADWTHWRNKNQINQAYNNLKNMTDDYILKN